VLRRLLARCLPRHRRSRLVAGLDRLCVTVHEAYENLNYDMHENGERFVLERLARQRPGATVFDVGANVGDWTALAAGLAPGATVHAFEIVPATHAQLVERVRGLPNVHAHPLGLGDAPGRVTVHYADDLRMVASCIEGASRSILGVETRPIEAEVSTGDAFCAARGIRAIDFLKIDVEGYEPHVLRGFRDMLGAGSIAMVQFEYGYVNAVERFLLRDFYDFLAPFGMRIGKIFPAHVEFRDYALREENFLGPNYLAVRETETSLIEALSG